MCDKVMTRDRINLFEKGESVKTELETVKVLHKFLSNINKNLEISKYSKFKSFIDGIKDQALRIHLTFIHFTTYLYTLKVQIKTFY